MYATSEDYASDLTPVTPHEIERLLSKHGIDHTRDGERVKAFDGDEWIDLTDYMREMLVGWLGY